MNVLAKFVNYIFVIFSIPVYAVPPESCFTEFRWDDCGKPPVPVIYYWKPGSRCEVAMWKGCLPNPNMFPDEYSCINTCIYVERAGPNDYEELKAPEDIKSGEETTASSNTTSGNTTDAEDKNDVTSGEAAGNTTGASANDTAT